MFNYCTSLKEVCFGDVDTSNVQLIGAMFLECINLRELDWSQFDASSVVNHEMLFWDALRLTKIKLGPNFPFCRR